MLVFLILGGLYGLSNQLDKQSLEVTRQENTGEALQKAKEALLAYAATYPDRNSATAHPFGYLPCPDVIGNGIAANSCATTGVSVIGLLPYQTLGLPDLRDSDGNCLWYAVSGNFKNSPPPSTLNWDSQGQFSIQSAQGATLTQPGDASGGAVAVIFAIGPPRNGQSRPSPNTNFPCGYAPQTTSHESFIFHDLANNIGRFNESTTTAILRAGQIGSSSNSNMLAWISPREIFTPIKARKATSNDGFVGRIRNLGNQIAAELTLGTVLPNPESPTSIGSLTYGQIPALSSLSEPAITDFQHWRAQYTYVKCTSNTKCLNSGTCTGMLLFAGERVSGGPRSSSTPPLSDYLEGQNLLAINTGGTSFVNAYGAQSTSSSFSISNANLPASGDEAICLNPKATQPFSIDNGFLSFQSTAPTGATVNTTLNRLTLGLSTSTSAATCSWNPTAVSLLTGLRAYFRFNIVDRGEGFTFALADATTNTSPIMCGRSGSALGYSGNTGGISPIRPPKLAIEFDTSEDNFSRNDVNDHHAAFVFWGGTSPDDNTDNTHGVCALPGGSPCNGNTNPQRRTLSLLDSGNTNQGRPDGDVYVRLDIVPVGTSQPPTAYTLKAYITNSTFQKSICELDGDTSGVLSTDVADVCTLTPTLSYTLTTTMSSAYLGFTMGQSSGLGSDQTILIDNLKVRSR